MSHQEPLLDRIAAQDGAVWLLVIVAALFPIELGTSHVGESDLASTVAAVLAAAAATFVVLAKRPPAGVVLLAAGLCTSGAAAIHFAVTNEHFNEWWGYGVFFFLAGWVQLLWATIAVRVHVPPLLVAAVTATLTTLGLLSAAGGHGH